MSSRLQRPAAALLMLVLWASIGASGVTPQTARAAAPFPPLDACLESGSFVLQDPVCAGRLPLRGDAFGPIDGVRQVTVGGDGSVRLAYPAGASADLDTPVGPCGDQGCPMAAVLWRAQGAGDAVGFVSGCGTRDATCTVTVRPRVGDAGEDVVVVYAQLYHGIRPVDGLAFALYRPPTRYPVRLNPIDVSGAPFPIDMEDRAYAVREGSTALQAECAPYDWDVADGPGGTSVPDCITLIADGSGRSGTFLGLLPNGQRWTITAAPSGDPGLPIAMRPTSYQSVSVPVADDDVWTTIEHQDRPALEVRLDPETTSMTLGDTQEVTLTLRAVGGDAGGLTSIAFAVPSVVETIAAPDAAVRVGLPEGGLPASLDLPLGGEITLRLPVTATGIGTTVLRVTADAIDDVGAHSVDGVSVPVRVDVGELVTGDLVPPRITRAHDIAGTAADVLEGRVEGTAGADATVSLALSPRGADGSCVAALDGPDVEPLGSVAVTIGEDGRGTFALTRRLGPGMAVVAMAVLDGVASPLGPCVPVTQEAPLVSIEGTEVAERTAAGAAAGADLTIHLADPAEGPVTVSVSTSDGSATAPADYTPLKAAVLTIPPGELSATIAVGIIADGETEPEETFGVALSDVVGGTLAPATPTDGPASVATVAIVDGGGAAGPLDLRGAWHVSYRTDGAWVTAKKDTTIRRFDRATGRFSGTMPGGEEDYQLTGRLKGRKLTATITIPNAGPHFHPGEFSCSIDPEARPLTLTCDYRSGSYRAKSRWTQATATPN